MIKSSRNHKVVFDTNIFVMALLGKSPYPALAVENALKSGQVLISPESFLEMKKKFFSSKFSSIKVSDKINYLESIQSRSSFVYCESFGAYCPDPDDDKIISAAVKGGAKYLVSEDKRHVLPLNGIQGLPKIINLYGYLREPFCMFNTSSSGLWPR